MMILMLMMIMIANVLAPLLQNSLKMLLQLVEHSVKLKPTLDCSIFPSIFSENAAATSRIFCQLKKKKSCLRKRFTLDNKHNDDDNNNDDDDDDDDDDDNDDNDDEEGKPK